MSSAPVAAIDLGTNTALLLVARRDSSGRLEILEECSETARLGRGLARSGRLEDASVERTLGILERYRSRAGELGVEPARLRVVGTAVLRRASDAERFLRGARDRLGLEIDVLSEEEEARLGHEAVAATHGEHVVIVDVGGGSTEVTANGGELRLSTPMGAVVMTERFLGLEGEPPVEDGGFGALVVAAVQGASAFPAGAAGESSVVLIGGTAANLACLESGAERFDPSHVEGVSVDAGAVAGWAERIAALGRADREELPIEADRAELLPAGLTCLAATMVRLEARRATTSALGLRHAVVNELLLRS